VSSRRFRDKLPARTETSVRLRPSTGVGLSREAKPLRPGGPAKRGAELSVDPLIETTIVIVSHNTREHLERCLGVASATRCEVIVVDTASTDGSSEFVRERCPTVRLVSLEQNAGFGAAANAGITTATTPYVFLLNADAWPLDECIHDIVELAIRNRDIGMIGPRLLNLDGSIQRSVFASPGGPVGLAVWATAPGIVSGAYAGVQRFVRALQHGSRPAAGSLKEQVVNDPEYLKGAALLLRRDAFEQVSGFDERFFMFSEEADLCYRLRRAGWLVVFAPAARVVHVGGASTQRYPDWMYRELLLSHLQLLAKHQGPAVAERARRLLVGVVRARAALHRGDRGRRYRAAADVLASKPTAQVIAE
jgi:GT2 family glycosyltransferase